MIGASLAFLVPAEIVYAILDLDRGYGESYDVGNIVLASATLTGGTGLALVAASCAYRGDSVRDAVRWTARRALPIIVLSVVSCVVFALGLILLIVPGLFVLTRWSIAWSSFADGDLSWRESLKRSNELVHGHSWRMLILVVALAIPYVAIDFGIWRTVSDVADSSVLAFGAAAAAGVLTLALEAAILYAVYERLRQADDGPSGYAPGRR